MSKTKPHSVRFEDSEYSFICRREGLKTAQSILDFFMKEYMKLYKIEKPSIFIQSTKDSLDGKETNVSSLDEVWQQPKGNYFAPTPIIPMVTQYESFINEINECTTNDQLEKTMLFVKHDQSLISKQKLYLEALAKKVFADKGFYKE